MFLTEAVLSSVLLDVRHAETIDPLSVENLENRIPEKRGLE